MPALPVRTHWINPVGQKETSRWEGGCLLAEDALAPSRFQRRHLSRCVLIVGGNAGVTDQHCIKVSLITLILQYRFATPKPLKTRPGPEGCRTIPFCNPSWCEPAAKILAGAWVLAQAEQDPDTANCKPC